MKYLIFGLGISGKSVAKYLLSKNVDVIGVDKKVKEYLSLKIYDEAVSLEGIDCCILSPGIPPSHPLVVRAREKKISILSEVAFAFGQIQNRCIGITGSNGKTTATLLITHVLNTNGIPARAVGNVGTSLTSAIGEDPNEVLVVELSSFQLEMLSVPCLDVAAILNISENHLDRHASMEEYAKIKLSIQNCLKEKGILLTTKRVREKYGVKGTISENVPFAICNQFGITEANFERSAKSFVPPPHRLELIPNRFGFLIYNDSKSTNVASTLYALEKVEGPVILIVGGLDKGSSYAPWRAPFQRKVRHIVAYGESRHKIEREIGFFSEFTKVLLFEEAVRFALKKGKKGETLLLSPGCSSYDQFDNFEQRGNTFTKFVQEGTWIEKKQS